MKTIHAITDFGNVTVIGIYEDLYNKGTFVVHFQQSVKTTLNTETRNYYLNNLKFETKAEVGTWLVKFLEKFSVLHIHRKFSHEPILEKEHLEALLQNLTTLKAIAEAQLVRNSEGEIILDEKGRALYSRNYLVHKLKEDEFIEE